jgi:signal transduction histidine kinase
MGIDAALLARPTSVNGGRVALPRRALVDVGLVDVALPVGIALAFALALAGTDGLGWRRALLAGALSALPVALLGPAVARVAARVPLASGPARALLVHSAAAIAFSASWAGAIAAEIALFTPRRDLEGFLRYGLAWQLVIGVIVYLVLVGVSTLRLARRRERDQQQVLDRSETLRLRAELDALRARLDPHFLFNALQTLGALVAERPADAQRALEHLASLLRRRLDHLGADSDLATLDAELADAREYLALERLALGERLRVREAIAPDTLPLLLPRFTLQPLVENAVRHGVSPRRSGGSILLSAMRDGDGRWVLRVADDGIGTGGPRAAAGRGIGLASVQERARLHFGPGADVRLEAAPGTGCIVTLRLPAVTDDEGSAEPPQRVR